MSIRTKHQNRLPLSHMLIFLSLFGLIFTQSNITIGPIVPIAAPNWLENSQSQLDTFLTDKYNYFVTPKGNKVWGCAMNLAWNDLKHVLLQGQDVLLNLTESDVIPRKVSQNLNSEIFTKEQLSQQSYYVQSGHGPSTIRKINFQVSQKFPQRTFQPLDQNIPQQAFVSFAYLFKRFQYKSAFNQAFNFKFKNTTVPAFQAVTSKQRSQLYIKYYNNDSDFMIGIQTASQNDEILLLKTPVKELNTMRLEKVLSLIEMYAERESEKLEMMDKFIMPVLEFDYTRVYAEMAKKGLLNEGFEKYSIQSMVERIKLKVDRFGVRLENQAVILLWRAMFMDQRRFFLNDDFWLILREKGKKPYFIILVKEAKEQWGN